MQKTVGKCSLPASMRSFFLYHLLQRPPYVNMLSSMLPTYPPGHKSPFPSTVRSQLRTLLDIANLQLRTVLLQHALVMILPKLLRGVLASDALENLGSAWVFVYEACFVNLELAFYYDN
jgi:hypothetical protein